MDLRVGKLSLVACSLAFLGQTIEARQFHSPRQFEFEHNTLRSVQASGQSLASRWFDVTYYILQFDIAVSPNNLRGHITITGACKSDTAGPLVLDLMNQMHVDSASLNGQSTSILQGTASLSISLDRRYLSGEQFSVDVYYQGVPVSTGFGSFNFSSHQNVPWIFSLSEPYGARDWWPCKDDPSDKADSADIFVTCNSQFKAGSNGKLLAATNNGDGSTTYHWQERYPIASYLLSVTLTNFSEFSNWFRYSPTDSMQILNYVLPEHLANALTTLPKTVDMLSIYSNLFGLYPFIKEKYGHAEFGSGGAMEHQTMTSTTTFDEDVISHELAHQWFGDMITCRSWSELWLNEGFAQYCSALYREVQYGKDSYWSYMNTQMALAVNAKGVIGIPDTSSVRNLFDAYRMYYKGASVHHMLRHVLGDSVYFRSLRSYANKPNLRYATATIRDFQTMCENVSGTSLNYFFQEWIYGEGFPHYQYDWSTMPSGNNIACDLEIIQSTSTGNPEFFTMPIDVRLSTPGWDTTVTVFNDSLQQHFKILLSRIPTSVLLDPDGWIIKLAFTGRPPDRYSLSQNYPNPFNPKTTIKFAVPTRSFVTISIFDLLGRTISTIVNDEKNAGAYSVDWNASSVASGIYIYRVTARSIDGSTSSQYIATKKMTVIK